MKKEQFMQFMEEGNLTVPKYLLNNYVNLGLNEKEFLLLLHIHSFVETGIIFPTPMEIAEKMTIEPSECMEILRHLLQKGYVGINDEMDEYSIKYERYSLQPLWEKMIQFMMNQSNESYQQTQHEQEINLYTIFEQEFGRPLSPFECESLSMWIDQDHHDPLIIKAALREAVISGKLNFRYIDRILFEWKKNGIKTISQANEYGKKFRKNQQKTHTTQPKKTGNNTIPFYNWLE
ncbi:DnaD domain-containing protein [Sutcliffiella rhizosphaerae]|uniref:DNA replication protein DnaD n=1 Tax=Sutcliffiella rhizosphaerae TaxID=2880967 RepID=A0ABM8YRN8_9BACI|nr:DnaD domain-containing protein [Sutcliffiella rhizosphaerae]CAG9622618.1 DNA replication protein DnaD [Sutcliffiella rhizosphaerae]